MPYLTLPIKYLLLLLVLGLFSVRSQTTGFNPFSRYAFGELAPIGGSAQQALAASGIALQTDTLPPTLVNMVNPAAWSDLRYTALDIGSDLQFQRIQQRSALTDYSNVRFLNATLALPLKKHGGLVLGIMPYSQSGYNLTQTLTAAAEIVRMHNEAANKGASMPEAMLNAVETPPAVSVQEKEIHSDEAYAKFNLFPITYKLFDQWSENIASTCQQLQRIARSEEHTSELQSH